MSHLPFTLLAYFFNAVVAVVDKFLLTKAIKDPLIYVFYFSIFSLIALVLLPFTHIPNLEVFTLASTSTLLWTTGAYFMLRALMRGDASRVIPVIGTLIPLMLVVFAYFSGDINTNEIWAVGFLILGLILLTLPDWRGQVTKGEILFEVVSAVFFAVSYIFLREAYERDAFLTVFAWSRVILIPVGIALVIIPYTRRIVLAQERSGFKLNSKMGVVFLMGQMAGGASELLLTFSVSLANPALVNSLQGTQYAFLFLFSGLLSKKYPTIYLERFTFNSIISKLLGVLMLVVGLYILAVSKIEQQFMSFGVTYSPRYAKSFGLDPKKTFVESMDELKYKFVRLPVYWDEVEKSEGKLDFSDAEFYLREAEKRGVSVILVLGYKQPRWPECFAPEWVEQLSKSEQHQKILKLVRSEVMYFREFGAINYWQVENEPLINFPFGLCNLDLDRESLLKQEIDIVRSLDKRPIVISDSGELSWWGRSGKYADLIGISLYRTVWTPQFNMVSYPIPPIFYNFKFELTKLFSGFKGGLLITELQAEPWANNGKPLYENTLDIQKDWFSAKQLQSNINFARQTKIKPILLWGVEWWYYMKEHGYPEYVDIVRSFSFDS